MDRVTPIKTALKRRLGHSRFYPGVRFLYDRLNPSVRRAIHADAAQARALLPKDALVFDVGAHIGTKTAAFLRADASVVAIEPAPDAFNELASRYRLNPRVTPVRAAVGASDGTAMLHLSAGSKTMHSLVEGWARSERVEPVEILTLNTLIERYGRPYYIKIDVEGAEELVLVGLSEPVPLISFEFHRSGHRRQPVAPIVTQIERLGAYEYSILPRGYARISGPFVPAQYLLDHLEPALMPGTPDSGDIFARRANGSRP